MLLGQLCTAGPDPGLEAVLLQGYCGLAEHEQYTAWMQEYRKEEPAPAPALLATLAQFQDGIIPGSAESLDPGAGAGAGPVVQHWLDTLQVQLLQAGAALQNSFMRSSQSWSCDERLGRALAGAGTVLDSLLDCVGVTQAEQSQILLLNTVHAELTSIKERGPTLLNRYSLYCTHQEWAVGTS